MSRNYLDVMMERKNGQPGTEEQLLKVAFLETHWTNCYKE